MENKAREVTSIARIPGDTTQWLAEIRWIIEEIEREIAIAKNEGRADIVRYRKSLLGEMMRVEKAGRQKAKEMATSSNQRTTDK